MSTKKGFTLIELIICIALFGVGLIAVFVVLINGFKVMSQARGQVVAINLTREGIEMMFNVRDTNLRKWTGKKDQCRLLPRPVFVANESACENEFRFWRGIAGWIPMYADYGVSKVPIMAGYASPLNIYDGINSLAGDGAFELLLDGNDTFTPSLFFSGSHVGTNCYQLLSGLLTSTSSCLPRKYSPAGRFYRVIKNVQLFDKNSTTTGGREMNCTKATDTDPFTGQPCGTSIAKELRFCSEVQYIVDDVIRTVTMCSVMTNFKE